MKTLMRRANLAPLIPVGLIALIVGPSVIRGQIPWFMDVVAQFYPIRFTAARTLHEGLVPLWNPYYHCGVPLLANPQWAVLYPINWIFFLWPNGHTFTLVYLIEHIIFALGGYWLARSLFESRLAALATSLVIALGGWTWAHYPFGAYLAAVCWAPWVLGCQERHVRDGRIKWIAIAGSLWGLQLLAGAPQAVFHCSQAYLVVALALAIAKRRIAPVALLFGALVIALLLSAAQLVPILDFVQQTVRGGKLPINQVEVGTLNLVGDGSLLNAFAGGNVFNPAEGEDAESTVFIGWIGLLLVVIGLIPKRREWRLTTLPYLIALALALLWSWRGLSHFLHPFMPGYGEFHDPKRVLLVAHIAVAVLIGAGIQRILIEKPLMERIPRVALFVIFAAALTVPLFTTRAPGDRVPGHQSEIDRSEHLAVGVESDMFPVELAEARTNRGALQDAPEWWQSTFVLTLFVIILPVFIAILCVAFIQEKPRALATGIALALLFNLFLFASLRVDTKTVQADWHFHNYITADEDTCDLLVYGLSNATPITIPTDELLPSRVATNDWGISYSYAYRGGRSTLLPNRAGRFGLRDAQGFDPAIPRRARLFFNLINEGFVTIYPKQFCLVRNWSSTLVDLMSLRWVSGAPVLTRWPEFQQVEPPLTEDEEAALNSRYQSTTQPYLWQNTHAEPRLAHRSHFIAAPDMEAAANALRLVQDRVSELTVLELPDFNPGEYALPTPSSMEIVSATETPNQIIASIIAPPGWVILRDQILPGWRAEIDGEPTPIYPADVLFRAVEWPGGEHVLTFAYQPVAWRLGWFISLATLAALIAMLGALRVRTRSQD